MKDRQSRGIRELRRVTKLVDEMINEGVFPGGERELGIWREYKMIGL